MRRAGSGFPDCGCNQHRSQNADPGIGRSAPVFEPMFVKANPGDTITFKPMQKAWTYQHFHPGAGRRQILESPARLRNHGEAGKTGRVPSGVQHAQDHGDGGRDPGRQTHQPGGREKDGRGKVRQNDGGQRPLFQSPGPGEATGARPQAPQSRGAGIASVSVTTAGRTRH